MFDPSKVSPFIHVSVSSSMLILADFYCGRVTQSILRTLFTSQVHRFFVTVARRLNVSPVADQWGNACSYIQSNFTGMFTVLYISGPLADNIYRFWNGRYVMLPTNKNATANLCSCPERLRFHSSEPRLWFRIGRRTPKRIEGRPHPTRSKSILNRAGW